MDWDYELHARDHHDLNRAPNQVRVVRKPEQPPATIDAVPLAGCPNCGTSERLNGAGTGRERRTGPRLAEIAPEVVVDLLLHDRKYVSAEAILCSDGEFYVVACQCGLSGQVTTTPKSAADSWRRAVARRLKVIQSKEKRA